MFRKLTQTTKHTTLSPHPTAFPSFPHFPAKAILKTDYISPTSLPNPSLGSLWRDPGDAGDPKNCIAISWDTSWEMIALALKNVAKILPKSTQNTSQIAPKSLQNPPLGGLWGVLGGSGGTMEAPFSRSGGSLHHFAAPIGSKWAPQLDLKSTKI